MERICEITHRAVDEKLKEQSDRMDKFEKEQDEMNAAAIKTEVVVANLCKQIESLVTTIKWAGCTVLLTLLGFFIWYIQQLPH